MEDPYVPETEVLETDFGFEGDELSDEDLDALDAIAEWSL